MTTAMTENVKASEYHRWPGVSPSRAKYAIESALAYKYACETPVQTTDEMELGTACHLAVWEPDLLPLRVVVWDGGQRRGKTWEQFETANAAKIILTDKAYQTVLRVRDRCQSHPRIREILKENGKTELSLQWEQHGLQCRGRIDFVGERIHDLKTAYCITDRAINSAVISRCYHLQAGAYSTGYEAVTGEAKAFDLIFAQTKPPYDARVVVVGDDEMARGIQLWEKALETIAEAERTGVYPGIDEHESPLILPEWELDNGDELSLTLDGEAVGM